MSIWCPRVTDSNSQEFHKSLTPRFLSNEIFKNKYYGILSLNFSFLFILSVFRLAALFANIALYFHKDLQITKYLEKNSFDFCRNAIIQREENNQYYSIFKLKKMRHREDN